MEFKVIRIALLTSLMMLSFYSHSFPLIVDQNLQKFPVTSNIGQRLELFSINLNSLSNQSSILRVIKPHKDRNHTGHILFEFLLTGQGNGPQAPTLRFGYSEHQALHLASLWAQNPNEYEKAMLLLQETLSRLQMNFIQFKMQNDQGRTVTTHILEDEISSLKNLENDFHRSLRKLTKLRIAKFYLPSNHNHDDPELVFIPQAWTSLVAQYKNLEWIRYTINHHQESLRRHESHIFSAHPLRIEDHLQEQIHRSHFRRNLSGNNLAEYTVDQNQVEVQEVEMHCAICNENEWFTLPCGHRFHGGCLDQLTQYQNKCPLCRDLIPLKNIRHHSDTDTI